VSTVLVLGAHQSGKSLFADLLALRLILDGHDVITEDRVRGRGFSEVWINELAPLSEEQINAIWLQEAIPLHPGTLRIPTRTAPEATVFTGDSVDNRAALEALLGARDLGLETGCFIAGIPKQQAQWKQERGGYYDRHRPLSKTIRHGNRGSR
jgi:hypothetical protein